MGWEGRACRGRCIFLYRKLFGVVHVDPDRPAKGISLARVQSAVGSCSDRLCGHLHIPIYRSRTVSKFARESVETAEHAAALAAGNCRIYLGDPLVRARSVSLRHLPAISASGGRYRWAVAGNDRFTRCAALGG